MRELRHTRVVEVLNQKEYGAARTPKTRVSMNLVTFVDRWIGRIVTLSGIFTENYVEFRVWFSEGPTDTSTRARARRRSEMKGTETVSANELAQIFGYANAGSVYTAISSGTFPIDTFRLGKRRVADKQVVLHYFEMKREEGLEKLRTEQLLA